MGVYIEVSGGAVVHSTTERYFNTGLDVQQYLAEWLKDDWKTAPGETKEFNLRKHTRIILSHPIRDIRKTLGEIPDNELSSAVRDRILSSRSAAPIMPAPKPKERVLADRKLKKDDDTDEPQPSSSSGSDTGTTTANTGTSTRKAATSEVMVLKDICRMPEVNMEPRIARQKLRKAYKGNDKQRWEWTKDEVPLVVAILTGKK